jgi:hypothetical protein
MIALAEQLRQASGALIGLVETMDPERWTYVPAAGVWSPGKEAEHVADGAARHLWIVRLSLGQKVSARPTIERARLTAERSQPDVADLLRQRSEEGVSLIGGLSDEQLNLPVRPPRARSALLGQLIETTLIGHFETHRREIEAKLRT